MCCRLSSPTTTKSGDDVSKAVSNEITNAVQNDVTDAVEDEDKVEVYGGKTRIIYVRPCKSPR